MFLVIIFRQEDSWFRPIKIRSGEKQGCVWAPTLFGIFFSVLLQHAFQFFSEGGLLHRTHHDGKLLNLTRLRAKTKVKTVLLREMLFADDAAFVSHTESRQQAIVDRFATACQDFGLTIMKKTEVLAMGTHPEPTILISNQALNSVNAFKYLGSTITSNLSLDSDLNALYAFSAPCCMGERHGLLTRDKKLDWTHSTSDSSANSWDHVEG